MHGDSLTAAIIWSFGPVVITETVMMTTLLVVLIGLLAWLGTRRLRLDAGPLQTALEGIVSAMENAIAEVAPNYAQRLLPFIGTLWIFLVFANLLGLIPGLHSPTRDLSATSALAVLVFLSVHWYGIRVRGLKGYLKEFAEPTPIMLPFNLVSDVTRIVALAVRLFGNIMSLEMAALLILLVAGFLAPVPILMLHIVEALVQAYIFGMLALIYVAGGMQSQQQRIERDTGDSDSTSTNDSPQKD
ncbi:MAG TPA: F0F1 ATP synthase subunit A [Spongiibacteraceae bacterium]|nr:F0F1 ATP synthase subunit A [Spongiibacteraceae bacterium]